MKKLLVLFLFFTVAAQAQQIKQNPNKVTVINSVDKHQQDDKQKTGQKPLFLQILLKGVQQTGQVCFLKHLMIDEQAGHQQN